jgi:hypothetical protein
VLCLMPCGRQSICPRRSEIDIDHYPHL